MSAVATRVLMIFGDRWFINMGIDIRSWRFRKQRDMINH